MRVHAGAWDGGESQQEGAARWLLTAWRPCPPGWHQPPGPPAREVGLAEVGPYTEGPAREATAAAGSAGRGAGACAPTEALQGRAPACGASCAWHRMHDRGGQLAHRKEQPGVVQVLVELLAGHARLHPAVHVFGVYLRATTRAGEGTALMAKRQCVTCAQSSRCASKTTASPRWRLHAGQLVWNASSQLHACRTLHGRHTRGGLPCGLRQQVPGRPAQGCRSETPAGERPAAAGEGGPLPAVCGSCATDPDRCRPAAPPRAPPATSPRQRG